MLTADSRATNPLTVSDLGPVRRMLGAHSMVIRVRDDGSLMPFEIMPELFLGRSIRELLTPEVRERFEAACLEVAATQVAGVFSAGDETDDVMIAPILDDDLRDCRFLVCWARLSADDGAAQLGGPGLRWTDLDLESVEVRFRSIGELDVEAAPWWTIGEDGVALWEHSQRVASLGLAHNVMAVVVTDAVPVLADHDDMRLRIEVPAPEMLNGLLQTLHATLRATGVEPNRIELSVPVEMAVDHDLLPLIVHLRTLGVQIDIAGLDALTAKLHTVSDTSDLQHVLPAPRLASSAGEWTTDPAEAARPAA